MTNIFTNLFNGEAIGPRTPMPVDSVEAQEMVSQSETLTYTVSKDAAGAFIEHGTTFSPIYNHLNDRVGSYWGIDDNKVYSTVTVDALTETAGSADVTITDPNNNLENLFETTEGSSLVKRYVLKVTDYNGSVLYGFIGGVAAATNAYTFTIFNDRVGETAQNWVGTLANFDLTTGAKLEIYTYQSSLSFGTGTTLTEEVEIPKEYTRKWMQLFLGKTYNVNRAADSLSNGQFFVDYYRGLIIGKKADGTNSETITYKIAASTITGVAGSSSSEVDVIKIGGTDVNLDDSAFAIGADAVVSPGLLVDDTATDSIDEGDVGVPRMSADRIPYVHGAVADDAVDAGNPISIGGIARSAQRAAVAALDRVKATFNLFGELVIAGYQYGANLLRVSETDPLDQHFVEEELVDTTNTTAATTYYPSSTGFSMSNYNNLSIHGVTSGGVTFTLEAKIDDSTDWVDITPAGYRLDDNTTGNASLVDQTFIMDFDDLHVRNVRIVSITSDNTNAEQYHIKRTAL